MPSQAGKICVTSRNSAEPGGMRLGAVPKHRREMKVTSRNGAEPEEKIYATSRSGAKSGREDVCD